MGKEDKIILQELEEWHSQDLIKEDLYNRLSVMYHTENWDFSTIIKWTLVIGAILISIGMISFITLLVQSMVFAILILTGLSFAAYYYGFNLKQREFKYYFPKTGNALIAIASLLLGADILAINVFIFDGAMQITTLIFLISLAYLGIAYFKETTLVLVFSLLGFATWFGAETGYSTWGIYSLGLNYPLRFALVSPLVILIGYLHQYLELAVPKSFIKTYYSFGLLFTNLSLWILSIIGTGGEVISTEIGSNSLELLLFSILWGVVNIVVFMIGTKFKIKMFVGYAVTFLILNLYTRYFEYFWDKMYKSLFFIILGGISVFIGLYCERKLSNQVSSD
ncbi:MAG: hypothetical protein ACQEQI_08175 [Bacillota bacterium]